MTELNIESLNIESQDNNKTMTETGMHKQSVWQQNILAKETATILMSNNELRTLITCNQLNMHTICY